MTKGTVQIYIRCYIYSHYPRHYLTGLILTSELLKAENFLQLESERCSRGKSEKDLKCERNLTPPLLKGVTWKTWEGMWEASRSIAGSQLMVLGKWEPQSYNFNKIQPIPWTARRQIFFYSLQQECNAAKALTSATHTCDLTDTASKTNKQTTNKKHCFNLFCLW